MARTDYSADERRIIDEKIDSKKQRQSWGTGGELILWVLKRGPFEKFEIHPGHLTENRVTVFAQPVVGEKGKD
jgi:hypothetical protein